MEEYRRNIDESDTIPVYGRGLYKDQIIDRMTQEAKSGE